MTKVIVVGAGIAGLKAATDLIKEGIDVVILEARSRIGGRAWTDSTAFKSVNFDMGCQLLHNASLDEPNNPKFNPWVGEAEKLGVKLIAEENELHYQIETARLSAEAGNEIGSMKENLDGLIAKAGNNGLQISGMEAVQTEQFSPWFWVAAGQIGPLEEATELTNFSVVDRSRVVEEGSNLLTFDGFGTLVARYGEALKKNIQLNTPVATVEYSNKRVTAVTQNRKEIHADGIIITVPTSIITRGDIQFRPPLPQEVQGAFAQLPLGHYMKIALEFDENILKTRPNDRVFTIPTSNGEPPWVFLTNLMGSNVVVAFLGGNYARTVQEIEAQHPGAAVQLALMQLRKMVGAEIEDRFTGQTAVTKWSNDPYSRGAYSYAVPQGSNARQILQGAAVLKRLFFAGEALSSSAYGTAHGAYLSGQLTAQRAAKHLLNKNK